MVFKKKNIEYFMTCSGTSQRKILTVPSRSPSAVSSYFLRCEEMEEIQFSSLWRLRPCFRRNECNKKLKEVWLSRLKWKIIFACHQMAQGHRLSLPPLLPRRCQCEIIGIFWFLGVTRKLSVFMALGAQVLRRLSWECPLLRCQVTLSDFKLGTPR